jgi:hypothetical protein
VNSCEVVDAREPQAEELVRPAVALEHMERERRVVVDAVDDDLHEMNAEGLDLGFIVGKDLHRKRKELWNVVIDMTTHVEHDDLSQLATANAVNTANLVIVKDGANHVNHSIKVGTVLY